MNRDIFFQILKWIEDSETLQNYCQTFPEYANGNMEYWRQVLIDNYGEEEVPTFRRRFEEVQNQWAKSYGLMTHLANNPKCSLYYEADHLSASAQHFLLMAEPTLELDELEDMNLKVYDRYPETYSLVLTFENHCQIVELTTEEFLKFLMRLNLEKVMFPNRDYQYASYPSFSNLPEDFRESDAQIMLELFYPDFHPLTNREKYFSLIYQESSGK